MVFEEGVLVFHPENIEIGDNVYVGHRVILKGYHRERMAIGDGTWIGQDCFFHSAGGIRIGRDVGIAPGVRILTSAHTGEPVEIPIMHTPLKMAPVEIGDGCDIGVGAILLPGVRLGEGVQVGAGAVVTKSFESFTVVAGVPAVRLRSRRGDDSRRAPP
ncbi:MAG: acyltransferase [Planctomycetota bacterium]